MLSKRQRRARCARAAAATGLSVVAALLSAAPAGAATVTLEPATSAARTFATSLSGWTGTISYAGPCVVPGLTCPAATAAHVASGGSGGAGDGLARTSFTTIAGSTSDFSSTWTAPAFTAPASIDDASLSLGVRSTIGGLLATGGHAALSARLVDLTTPAESVALLNDQPLSTSTGFVTVDAEAPPGAIIAGHTYAIELRADVTTPAALVATGSIDLDDVVLTLVDRRPPTDLTAAYPGSGPARIAGTVDPHDQPVSVSVRYGTTAAYGTTIDGGSVSGTGPQPFSIGLAGLTPGTTYHYQVTADGADGSVATGNATFVAPAPPPDSPPTVQGAANSRDRTVVFDRDGSVTAATVQILTTTGTVLASFPDDGADGQVAVTLPPGDGAYDVRVIRTVASTPAPSQTTRTTLDRTPPDLSGADLDVTPARSANSLRFATFSLPTDAVDAGVQLLDDAGSPAAAPIAGNAGYASLPIDGGDGIYRIRLTVHDAAGNAATALSADLELDRTAPDAGGPPTVDGAPDQRARTVTFTRAPDAMVATIEVLDAAGSTVDTVSAASNSGAVALPDADADYQVRVRQSDEFGNASATASTTAALLRSAAPNPTPDDDPLPDDPPLGNPLPGDPLPMADPLPVVLAPAIGPPVPTTPGVMAAPSTQELLRACLGADLALTEIRIDRNTVRFAGVSVLGQGVPITIRDEGGRPVAATRTTASGAFRTTAVRWTSSSRTMFRASAGRSRSRAVAALRANELLAVSTRGPHVTLSGRLDLRRVGRGVRLQVRGGPMPGGCSTKAPAVKQSGRVELDRRTGRYRLQVTLPRTAGPFVLRVRATGTRYAVSDSLFFIY